MVLVLAAGTAAHGQDGTLRGEFTAATTACLAAQQDTAFDDEPITTSGFEAQQVPSEFEDQLLIFARPGIAIAITVDREDVTCAVRWDVETDAPSEFVDRVVEQMFEEAGDVQRAPPADRGESTSYPFVSGNALGLLVVTEDADAALFQFVAVNRSQPAN